MSNHDRTKWDYFTNMGVIEFLNTLSFYKDKEKELATKKWQESIRAKNK